MQQANPATLVSRPAPLHVALDAGSPAPLYVQLRDGLRDLIARGVLRRGERLAPTRELARDLGVNRTTVAAAYAELESEGLLEGHVGRGTFVAGEAVRNVAPEPARAAERFSWEQYFREPAAPDGLDAIMQAAGEPGVISFAAAHPPSQALPVAEFRRACDTVLRRHGSRVFQAGASDGLAELRDWLSGWLGKQGVPAAAEEITITNGCQQSLDLLAKAMVDSGQAVAVENPIYPGALLPFRQAGARVVPVPAGREGVDLEALEAISERQRIRLLLVTPNFQNPTSATMPDAARRRLVEIARRRQVAIVENDSYGLLRYEGHPQTPLKALAPDEVIYLGSFSKVGFPGLRLGWCAAPAALSARLRRAKQATDLHTDHFVQAVMLEFAERGGLARAVRAVREACRRNAATLVQEAAPRMPEGVRWERPRGGISAWFTLPQEVDAEAVLARARGVVFTPGRFFYFHEPQANTLRLSFGNLTPRAIARGVAVLADAIRAEMRQRARAPRRATPGVRLALV